MTDLRDRIAAVIAIHADYIANGIRHCTCGAWSGDSQTTRIGFASHVADVVIEDPKLVGCAYCDWVGTPEELTTQHLNGCP
jgi:hypothetical protein